MQLAPVDALVLGGYLLLALGLGAWLGRGQRSLDDYLLGGRNLPWWAILGSIVATETSTASFLSLPGLAFAEGGDLRMLQLAIGYVVGRVLVATLLLPGYFAGKLTSAYALLGERFGAGTQRLASAIFLLARNASDGLRLFLAALALEAIGGLPLEVSVLVIGVGTAVYTVFGGLRSVVWNDCAQLVVYLVGGALLLWAALAGIEGGWGTVVEFGESSGRWRWFDPSFDLADPLGFWAGLVGGAALTLGVHGTDQMLVQRYLGARSQREAARALIGSGLVVAAQFALFLVLGVVLAAHAAQHAAGETIASDQAVARFVGTDLPAGTGAVGLLLAAVLAASMSTLSSSLNSSATSLLEDWIRPVRRAPLEGAAALRLGRWLTLAFALLQVGVALGAARISTSVVTEVLAVAGFSAGLLLGAFGLARLVPRAGAREANLALVGAAGLLLALRLSLGSEIAWTWTPAIGALAVLVLGTLASRLRAA